MKSDQNRQDKDANGYKLIQEKKSHVIREQMFLMRKKQCERDTLFWSWFRVLIIHEDETKTRDLLWSTTRDLWKNNNPWLVSRSYRPKCSHYSRCTRDHLTKKQTTLKTPLLPWQLEVNLKQDITQQLVMQWHYTKHNTENTTQDLDQCT